MVKLEMKEKQVLNVLVRFNPSYFWVGTYNIKIICLYNENKEKK